MQTCETHKLSDARRFHIQMNCRSRSPTNSAHKNNEFLLIQVAITHIYKREEDRHTSVSSNTVIIICFSCLVSLCWEFLLHPRGTCDLRPEAGNFPLHQEEPVFLHGDEDSETLPALTSTPAITEMLWMLPHSFPFSVWCKSFIYGAARV